MVYIPPELVFAGVQAGLGFFGDMSGREQQERQQREQLKFQRRKQQREVRRTNEGIDRQNALADIVDRVRQRQAAQNKQFAIDAANRAYLGGAINRDRQLTSLAFDRSDRQAQLLQAVGAGNAAMEGDNRSGRRAFMMDTYGNFGRTSSRDKLRISDINADERLAAADVRGQLGARLAQIDASVAIPTMRRRHVQMGPMASMPRANYGMQNFFSGANHLMGALSTYNDLAPPGKKLFGE